MIRFELVGGLIIVPTRFIYSSQISIEADAIVDTGSAGTALDTTLVELDRTIPSRICEIVGVGGNQDVVIQEIDAVLFGNYRTNRVEVEFGDITSVFCFSAIIGSDLLDALGACIDYYTKEIRIARTN